MGHHFITITSFPFILPLKSKANSSVKESGISVIQAKLMSGAQPSFTALRALFISITSLTESFSLLKEKKRTAL